MKKLFIIACALLFTGTFTQAQTKAADTVVIKVGEASRITFTIQSKEDLETLKKYDFQSLMNDLIAKLEQKDTSSNVHSSQDYLKKDSTSNGAIVSETENETSEVSSDDEDWSNHDNHYHEKRHHRSTYQSFNFDFGTNNYLSGGKFPDQDNSLYTVKPWGSWYV